METRESHTSPGRLVTPLFWGLTAVEGALAFYGLTLLPKSETERAVIAGFSLLRLLTLAFTILASLGAGAVFGLCLLNRRKAESLHKKTVCWFQLHDFTVSALVMILFAWFLAGLLLEILLNPTFFPRAILYQFLYVRIRPVFLWTVVVSLQTACMILLSGSFKIRKNPLQKSTKRVGIYAFPGILTALAGVIALWSVYGAGPAAFSDGNLTINIWLIIILVILAASIYFFNPSIKKEDEIPSLSVAAVQTVPKPGNGLYTIVYGGFFLLLLFMYVYSSYVVPALPDPNNLNHARIEQVFFGYGFNHFRWLPPILVIIWFFITGTVMFWIHRNPASASRVIDRITRTFYSHRLYPVFAALLFTGFASYFHTVYINEDTQKVMRWVPRDAAHGVMHVRFDQMFESNLHYEAYKLFNRWWGLSVESTYTVLSCLAGFFFIYVLLILCRRVSGKKALLVAVFLISGGYMQLFFGDMENYTLTAVLLITFFYCAWLYIKNELSLLMPAFVLTMAMMFHMETAYLLPALFFLTIIEIHRRRFLSALAAWGVVVIIFSLTLLYFVHNGASFDVMLNTSWGLGRGGSVLYNIVIPDLINLFSRMNMVALVFPLIWLLLPVLLLGGLKPDFMDGFLMVAAACGIVFPFFWISTNGYFCDLTMFSLPIMSSIFLLGTIWFKTRYFPLKNELWTGMVMTVFLFSYTWIIHNHFLN